MAIGGGVLLAAVGLAALIGHDSSPPGPPPSAPSAAKPAAGKSETDNAVVPPAPLKVDGLPATSPKIVAQATPRIEKKAEMSSSPPPKKEVAAAAEAPASGGAAFPEEILEIEGRRIAVAKHLLCWQSREDLAALRDHAAPGMTWQRFFDEFGWKAFSGPSGRWLGNDKLVPYIDSSGDKNTFFCVSYDLAPH